MKSQQYNPELIEVYDNFFDEDIREEVYNYLQRPKWSLTGGTPENSFWHMDNLEEENYFSDYLFQEIKEKIDKINDYNILRVYANGQTFGQCGTPHMDDGDYTLLYYPNPDWCCWKYQGNLMFMNLDYNTDKVVAYKPDRLVCFPANTVHYAESPSINFTGLRISLAYKLVKK